MICIFNFNSQNFTKAKTELCISIDHNVNITTGLNRLQSRIHKQYMNDLFVELCLTVPVRLRSAIRTYMLLRMYVRMSPNVLNVEVCSISLCMYMCVYMCACVCACVCVCVCTRARTL